MHLKKKIYGYIHVSIILVSAYMYLLILLDHLQKRNRKLNATKSDTMEENKAIIFLQCLVMTCIYSFLWCERGFFWFEKTGGIIFCFGGGGGVHYTT